MNRDDLIRKVVAKLEEQNFDKDGGLKEWIMGGMLALTTLLGNPDKAFSEAQDVNDYLNKAKQVVEKKDPSGKELAVKNRYKPGQGKSGSGSFTVDLGPYQLKGEYYTSGIVNNFKVNLLTERGASKEDLKKWKPNVDKVYKKIQEAFKKGEKNFKSDNKNPFKHVQDAWKDHKKRNQSLIINNLFINIFMNKYQNIGFYE